MGAAPREPAQPPVPGHGLAAAGAELGGASVWPWACQFVSVCFLVDKMGSLAMVPMTQEDAGDAREAVTMHMAVVELAMVTGVTVVHVS